MARTERLTTWQVLQNRTRHGDSIFWLLTLFFALIVIALVFAVGYVTWAGSSEARSHFGLSFLWQTGWDANAGNSVSYTHLTLPTIYSV